MRKLYQAEARIFGLVRSQYLPSWTLKKEEEKRLNMCCEPDEAKMMINELSHQTASSVNKIDSIKELIKSEEWEKAIESIQKEIEVDLA
ncbi:MAG: hypothetical protein NTY07_15135, partial [Bacteroidia bacterium]|nr:hypothetical protein [Bacteroidia bacterium]